MAPTVVLHVWGIHRRHVMRAMLLTALTPLGVRATGRPRFHKALGTGSGQTFTLRDADWTHWAMLTVWPDAASASNFDGSWLARAWARRATEVLRVEMEPLASRGSWSRRQPFTGWSSPADNHEDHCTAIAAITRARVKVRHWRTFSRAVPAVSADLHATNGPVFSLGIGEAPVGLQGTFSVWRNAADLHEFAYGRTAHRQAIKQTHATGWYAEELFARLRVVHCSGTYNGAPINFGGRA